MVTSARTAWFSSAVLLLLPLASTADAQFLRQQSPTIDKISTLILLRSAMSAINQANATNNYTVLRELGCPQFQAANSSSRLSDAFAPLRPQNLDLSGVAVIEPQFTTPPTVNGSGSLHMIGFFPSAPIQIQFDFTFATTNGRYCAEALSIGLERPASPIGVGTAPGTTDAKSRKPNPPDSTSRIGRDPNK